MIFYADIPGERLDAFLARVAENLSRSSAQKLIEDGCVLRQGKPGKKNDKLNVDDEISVTFPEPKPVQITATDIPLDIVYEDQDVLVVNKPKGLVVHPAAGHQDDTLVNGLLYAMGDDLSGINGELRPGIVHRIDKDTSGLLAVAKNDFAHTMLASQLKDHSMARTYEAIVCGNLKEDSGTVDAPIGRHPSDRKKMCVTPRNSREAVTHWEVIARYRGYTHVRCKLETGRTHQIRVHMAHIGHPILGDTVYGRKKPELGQDSQCLHAGVLCFRHPRDLRPVMVVAPLPEYFQEVLHKLKKTSGI
ncbi:MAG: RluA family pseudouridine synthase [Oscillospiraceae bacterium]|nr:RluA family pseudouridine synthase [Oscillospiraceae bacterium]MBR4109108.1 RluA family pseudouridine synthase [Oscillospiraceae bacterium]